MPTGSDHTSHTPGTREADRPLLTAVLDALPELVFVFDRDGYYVDVLGGRDDARYHDGRSLVGQRMHDVLAPELADRFLAHVHQALDTGGVVTCEYTLSAQDVTGVESRPGVPDHLWFEGRIAPLAPVAGRDDLVVWMPLNVTETRVATRQLERQRAELEALATAKERILSVLSHDLRAPLTAIQGFLELLDEYADKLDTDRAHDLLRRSHTRAVQMQQMLAELLDASRHEYRETSPQPRDVPVADMLRDIVDGLQGAEHDVVVTDARGRVTVDPGHLERIIVNLVDNARKYGAPPIMVTAHQADQHVHIRVRDHGDGVPPEFIPTLFTPFTQAGPTPADSGVGLGLSIVQQLAQQNGGDVSYEPQPDGACFLVALPATDPQTPPSG